MRLIPLLVLEACLLQAAPPVLHVESVKRIWGEAPHSAFGDIIRFHDKWFVIFRESDNHVTAPPKQSDGTLRVISSRDGESWQPEARIAEAGIDLRDPHLSITADGRLMAVCGGSEYPSGEYKGRQPRVTFSADGAHWTAPRKVLERGHWLWRVDWHDGQAWGISKYGSYGKELPEEPRRVNLVRSKDGIQWETVKELKVPGGDETTVRFLPDGRMVALMRRRLQSGDASGIIGFARAPYTDWKWTEMSDFIGGPNFIVLPDGRMIAGGRWFQGGDRTKAKTGLGAMTVTGYKPELALPSGGDNSYPGFAYDGNTLWTLYYSSHEGKTAMYLAKIRVQ